MWSRFGRDFPAPIRDQGRKSTNTVHQIGGARPQDIVVLPEAHLAIGTFDAVLRPTEVFGPSVGDDVHHGNMGMSMLGQATAVHHRLEGYAPDAALTALAPAGLA